MGSDYALRMRSRGRRRGRDRGAPGGGLAATRRITSSYWSTPLAADAPLASTSADLVARLAYQTTLSPTSTPVKGVYGGAFRTNVDQGSYSTAIYVLPENTPRVPVWGIDNKGGGWRGILARGVPLPDPASLPGGTIAPQGTDGSVIFICGTELWEMWRFQPASGAPAGYDWMCKQGGYMRNYLTHPGWYAGSGFFGGGSAGRPGGFDWGVSATGLSYLGSILTTEDFNAATINHPLAVAIPITGGQTARGDVPRLLPTTRYDQLSFVASGNVQAEIEAKRVPEGARFRLPVASWSDATIDAYAAANGIAPGTEGRNGSTAAVLSKVLRCLRDYGVLVTDSSGVVGFAAEHLKTYGTAYHSANGMTRPLWGNFAQQLPWSSLVQVAAPTVDISVPGPAANGEPFSDDFNRADSPTTGNLWHEGDVNSAGEHPIINNQMGLATTTVETHFAVAPFYSEPGDQFAQITVTALPTSTSPHPGPMVRFGERFANGYMGRYNPGAGWEIHRVDGPRIAIVSAAAPSLPYTLRIEARGNVMTLLCNGTQVATGTDSTHTGGGAAVAMRWNVAGDEAQRVDSFSCGSL